MRHIRMHSTDGPRWDLYIPSGLEQVQVYKAFTKRLTGVASLQG